jgi:hypothetical protein
MFTLEQGRSEMNHQYNLTVTVEREGKIYKATYRIENGMITVTTSYGSKTTQLGSCPPEALAIIMLGEMISEGNEGERDPL